MRTLAPSPLSISTKTWPASSPSAVRTSTYATTSFNGPSLRLTVVACATVAAGPSVPAVWPFSSAAAAAVGRRICETRQLVDARNDWPNGAPDRDRT